MAALVGGQVSMAFETSLTVAPHVKFGKLRALAVASSNRIAILPEVPTLAEAGYPGILSENWYGLYAPAGTPKDAISRIHADLAKAVADIHTHPPHVSALSMIGEPLAVSHMDTAMFYEDCAWLPDYPGVPIGDEEGRIISEALGEKRSILLAHHGQLAACKTIEEATMLSIFIERAAKLQLLARAAGTIRDIKPECAREAHDYRLKPKYVDAVFCYYARQVLRQSPHVLQ